MKNKPKTLADLTAAGILSESWLDSKEVEEEDEQPGDETTPANEAPVDPTAPQVMPDGSQTMPAVDATANEAENEQEDELPPLEPTAEAPAAEQPKSESAKIVEEIEAMLSGATRLAALALAMDPTNADVKALYDKLTVGAAAAPAKEDAPLEPEEA